MMTGLQPLAQDPDINLPTLKLRLLNALGIDTAGLLLTQDEKLQRMAEQSSQQQSSKVLVLLVRTWVLRSVRVLARIWLRLNPHYRNNERVRLRDNDLRHP
ncbi:portal (connector) protein [Enterobacter phage 01_vB_Eclo_IJM]|nr:portal (connector) protein [Enterobacter phage 01_vB_Eclo_IJM]